MIPRPVQAIYEHMPAHARSIPASARGYVLHRRRKGGDFEALVEAAAERDGWTASRWQAWQAEQLEQRLVEAARAVPWYREYWATRRGSSQRRSIVDLSEWPILEKATVRANPFAFVADGSANLTLTHTSGTSGTPLQVRAGPGDLRAWYALQELRIRRWHGIAPGDRWVIFGGQLVQPVSRRRPPYWVKNIPMHQLYCSVYHLAPDTVADYATALRRFAPRYVLGYPSALASLASLAAAAGQDLPQVHHVASNAEPLSDAQRQVIGAGFGVLPRNTYGMAEMVAGASECGYGTMHQWPDAGVLELDDDRQGDDPSLVLTGFTNRSMPLVRYRIGDRAIAADDETSCGCGRALPRMPMVIGRSDDVLSMPDGRLVGRLDTVFKADLPIDGAQIVHVAPDQVEVRVVPAQGYSPMTAPSLVREVGRRMSGIEVRVVEVNRLERGANGKIPGVIVRFTADDAAPPAPAPGAATIAGPSPRNPGPGRTPHAPHS